MARAWKRYRPVSITDLRTRKWLQLKSFVWNVKIPEIKRKQSCRRCLVY